MSNNSLILSHDNQEKFLKIYASFAKSEPNAMRFSQFMQFLLDRCLITNKTTLKHFYALFIEATEIRIAKEEAPPNNIVFEKTIKKEELIYLFNELGKFMYHSTKGQQDKIYNSLLGEQVTIEKGVVIPPRVMVFDEVNRKMFLENAISTLSFYEDQLKNMYLIYVEENYWSIKKDKRLLLSHREIELQNKRMSALSFVRFLKAAEIVPHIINVEQVQQIISRIIPATSPKENQFFYKHFLIEAYSKNLQNPQLKHIGDPGLVLFQFMVALGRIAVQTSKETENDKKLYNYVLSKFFKDFMHLRNNDEIAEGVKIRRVNKNHIAKLQEYNQLQDQQNGGFKHSEKEFIDPFTILKQKQSQLEDLPPKDFDIPSMLKIIQSQILPMPQKLVVDQQLPPPYPKKFKDVEKVIIGQQPPPQKGKKSSTMKPPPKKSNLKGQDPPRVFKFDDIEKHKKKNRNSDDYFQDLATDLDYSLKPLASLDRGTIPLDPFPSLISQVLYPPDLPQILLPFIEAGLNANNENLYALALDNFNKAHTMWKKQEQVAELKPSTQLYFEFTRGSVYQSAGRDDYAFNAYYECRNYSQKLTFLSPDRALPYCGMGQVLYNAEQFEMAARCYLKARQIREKLLGIQSIDTATTLNNLGCCFFMVDRNKEALGYFKIAHTIMVSQLGQFHERTQATKENTAICNKGFYRNRPQFRKLWQVYEKDPFGKKKKKKAKK